MARHTDTVYGLHAVGSLLDNRPESVTSLSVMEGESSSRLNELTDRAERAGIHVERVSRRELDGQFPGVAHQGVVASLRSAGRDYHERDLPVFLENLEGAAFLLVLDGVQDPHNLGACLRTADAAGVDAVILPKDRAVGITAVVRKVASGAAESVPVFTVTNLARTLRQLKEAGIWLYGTSDTAADSLYDINLAGPAAFVLGSEGKGIRRLTAELCDHAVAVPMAGQVSSLNVSVAAGVVLFEARRQRSLKNKQNQ
jgi:23S rRNA (guanosine2251-2'-O)-methyltransferase